MDCGVGYVGKGGLCSGLQHPIVLIENKPAGVVGRRQDLVLRSRIYFFAGDLAKIEWVLQGDDAFFDNTINGQEYLVIPKTSLLQDKHYHLTIVVTASNGNTGQDTVQFRTSKQIHQGTFELTPSSGRSFDTTFQIRFNVKYSPYILFY